ncbi:unnamed protein product [Pleuronectes platessa]|uniref:Uncharacterized protein n=1 Tax=Pleuronectes platessa TaxID=8262 RepID=A0A9N7YRA8_PLEPL|nr:unnamed protein product [Pleuronectes platessa]
MAAAAAAAAAAVERTDKSSLKTNRSMLQPVLDGITDRTRPLLSLLSPPLPFSPPSLTPHSFLSHSAVPVAGWGGRLGASTLLQTHCRAVMVVVVLLAAQGAFGGYVRLEEVVGGGS